METQKKPKQESADAQGAFQEQSNLRKHIKLVHINDPEPSAREIAIRRITERNWVKAIAKSSDPVIIITESRASDHYASYEMMKKAMPDVSIVFESDVAKANFAKGRFYDRELMHKTCIGHFEKADDRTTMLSEKCLDIQKADCIIVLGSPQADLRRELNGHAQCFINETNAPSTAPRVNFSMLMDMRRNKATWKAAREKRMELPSL